MRRKYKISKARILQVSNDIAEDIYTATKKEYIEVGRYFADELYFEVQKRMALKSSMAIKLAEAITELAKK